MFSNMGDVKCQKTKGGNIAMKTVELITMLPSIVVTYALFSCNTGLRKYGKFCLSDFAIETATADREILKGQLASCSGGQIFCLQIPGTKQIYIATTKHFFSNFIFDRINSVRR